ncbi:MAG: PadR family transcriptional regulator [Defluviitaleaceae bacterium]|nr:PadR family transcriptional regulator [Defluviitaleaceae bacterium]
MAFAVSGALLDACVLGTLSSAPAYGYELTQRTQNTLGVSESALYPVLRRLLKDNLLSSYDEPHDGRNRRYYQLTEKGMILFQTYVEDWQVFKANIDTMIFSNNQGGLNLDE